MIFKHNHNSTFVRRKTKSQFNYFNSLWINANYFKKDHVAFCRDRSLDRSQLLFSCANTLACIMCSNHVKHFANCKWLKFFSNVRMNTCIQFMRFDVLSILYQRTNNLDDVIYFIHSQVDSKVFFKKTLSRNLLTRWCFKLLNFKFINLYAIKSSRLDNSMRTHSNLMTVANLNSAQWVLQFWINN